MMKLRHQPLTHRPPGALVCQGVPVDRAYTTVIVPVSQWELSAGNNHSERAMEIGGCLHQESHDQIHVLPTDREQQSGQDSSNSEYTHSRRP